MKTILLAIALLFSPQLINTGHHRQVGAVNPCAGTVGCWPMNEGTGATFYDHSGNSNNVVVATPANFTWTSYGLDFPNIPDFNGTAAGAVGTSGAPTNFERTDTWSVSAWVNVNVSPGVGNFLGNCLASSSYQGWCLQDAYGSPTQNFFFFFTSNISSGNYIAIESAETLGNCYAGSSYGLCNLIVTSTGSSTAAGITIYMNGNAVVGNIVVKDALTATTKSNNPISFMSFSDNSDPTTGYMAFVKVYNTTLSSTQAAAIYAAGPQ